MNASPQVMGITSRGFYLRLFVFLASIFHVSVVSKTDLCFVKSKMWIHIHAICFSTLILSKLEMITENSDVKIVLLARREPNQKVIKRVISFHNAFCSNSLSILLACHCSGVWEFLNQYSVSVAQNNHYITERT